MQEIISLCSFGNKAIMAFTHIFALAIFAFAVDALDWKNCDGSSPVQIGEITFSPHPLKLRPGEEVTFSGKFTVSEAAGPHYKIDVTLWKAWWGTWIWIPCFGRCNHEIRCDQMVGLLEGAQCPLQHGTYEVKKQTHTLPNVSIPSFLKNGKYKIRGDLRDKANNKSISCVEAKVEITS